MKFLAHLTYDGMPSCRCWESWEIVGAKQLQQGLYRKAQDQYPHPGYGKREVPFFRFPTVPQALCLPAAGLENLPPEAAERIVAELRNIKDTYGSWELVEVCSADGENVKITL